MNSHFPTEGGGGRPLRQALEGILPSSPPFPFGTTPVQKGVMSHLHLRLLFLGSKVEAQPYPLLRDFWTNPLEPHVARYIFNSQRASSFMRVSYNLVLEYLLRRMSHGCRKETAFVYQVLGLRSIMELISFRGVLALLSHMPNYHDIVSSRILPFNPVFLKTRLYLSGVPFLCLEQSSVPALFCIFFTVRLKAMS